MTGNMRKREPGSPEPLSCLLFLLHRRWRTELLLCSLKRAADRSTMLLFAVINRWCSLVRDERENGEGGGEERGGRGAERRETPEMAFAGARWPAHGPPSSAAAWRQRRGEKRERREKGCRRWSSLVALPGCSLLSPALFRRGGGAADF
ncbi:hypothetical protein R3W88_022859 [Solanum pinnatisectum]|uniref:Uncharacterized protein n=1 Tax=Solanum pinnatisectum TaxID=50273 RepID=A0AAV9LVX0_9SOLN|nr:hypothetical protein R3W88_022859 [Solanum pinnatisectum]